MGILLRMKNFLSILMDGKIVTSSIIDLKFCKSYCEDSRIDSHSASTINPLQSHKPPVNLTRNRKKTHLTIEFIQFFQEHKSNSIYNCTFNHHNYVKKQFKHTRDTDLQILNSILTMISQKSSLNSQIRLEQLSLEFFFFICFFLQL